MFALDTNILVYAHNLDSPLCSKAKSFIARQLTEEDNAGNPLIGIPLQVCAEFINVITRQTIGEPLTLLDAISVVRDYIELIRVPVIHPKPTQLRTFLELLESITTRKKVFDVALAATLKDNGVEGLYTVNVDDFKDFQFLQVVNPLA